MQNTIPVVAILFLCAAIGLAGCISPTSTTATPPTATAPAATQAPSAQNNLVVSPTDVIPENNQVSVTIKEKEYDATIAVAFAGGKGQYLTKSARIVFYRSDGQVISEKLGIKKDDTTILQGSKQTDRVVVYVSQVTGQEYKVADVLREYRTR